MDLYRTAFQDVQKHQKHQYLPSQEQLSLPMLLQQAETYRYATTGICINSTIIIHAMSRSTFLLMPLSGNTSKLTVFTKINGHKTCN